jgi:hypothetical protein
MPAVLAVSVGSGVTPDIVTEDFAPRVWMCDHRKVIDDEVEPGRLINWQDPVFSEKFELCEILEKECQTACVGNTHYVYQEVCGIGCDDEICGLEEPTEEIQKENFCKTICEEKLYKEPCDILKGFELAERHNNYAFEGEKLEWVVLVMDKNKIEEITDVVATIGDQQGSYNDIEVECVELHSYALPGESIDPSCNARILEEEIDQFDDQTMAYYECTLTVETPESMYGEYYITVEAIDSTT